jgi:hypothetical protein
LLFETEANSNGVARTSGNLQPRSSKRGRRCSLNRFPGWAEREEPTGLFAAVSAIITSYALPDGGRARILGYVQAQSRPPNLIVASRLANGRLWAEVLNLGGYDLFVQRFVADEVGRVVSLACGLPARRESLAGEPAKANFAAFAASSPEADVRPRLGGAHARMLEDRHAEVLAAMRQREAIAVDRSPDVIEEIQAAVERERTVVELPACGVRRGEQALAVS